MNICGMKMDDDLYARYEKEAQDRNLPVLQVLADRLERSETLDPRSRYLIVAGEAQEQLEKILGGGHVLATNDLLHKVSRLARIRFGDHVIELTPGQLEEIAWRAKKQGKTVEQGIQLAFEAFAHNFFEYQKV